MSLILIVFVVMIVVMLIMSVGVIMGKKPLTGSCGGLSSLGMKTSCDICGGVDKCEKEEMLQKQSAQGRDKLAYDATLKK